MTDEKPKTLSVRRKKINFAQCPFCGCFPKSSQVVIDKKLRYAMSCQGVKCGATILGDSHLDVIQKWNRRLLNMKDGKLV